MEALFEKQVWENEKETLWWKSLKSIPDRIQQVQVPWGRNKIRSLEEQKDDGRGMVVIGDSYTR